MQVGIGKQFWINILSISASFPFQKQRLQFHTKAGNLRVDLCAEGGPEVRIAQESGL